MRLTHEDYTWSIFKGPWLPGEVIKIARHMQNGFAREWCTLRSRRAAEMNALECQFYGRSMAAARPYPQPEHVAGQRRTFHPERFAGLEGGELYLVTGKGGLVREIVIPGDLARELEACRLTTPKVVRDRDGRYEAEYDLPGGRLWERSFSRASLLELGFSCGGHGLRHGYVQDRFRYYLEAGYSIRAAKTIVAAEVGHFRPDVTDVYRR